MTEYRLYHTSLSVIRLTCLSEVCRLQRYGERDLQLFGVRVVLSCNKRERVDPLGLEQDGFPVGSFYFGRAVLRLLSWLLLVCVFVPGLRSQVLLDGAITSIRTGENNPLLTAEWAFDVPSYEFEPVLELEFGFSSEEPEALGLFLDSFSLTLQGGAAGETSLLVTSDPTGVVWAPDTPGALVVDLLDLAYAEASFATLDPVYPLSSAFSVSYRLPESYAGEALHLYGDLFNNLNEWASVAYVIAPRISSLPAVDVSVTTSDVGLLLSRGAVGFVTVTNSGPDDASGVVVTAVVTGGVGIAGGVAESGVWSVSTEGWVWEVGFVGAGEAVMLELSFTGDAEGGWSQVVSVEAVELETAYANNSVSWTGQVLPLSGLEIGLVGDSLRLLEEEWTDVLVVTNRGPSMATGVSLRGVVPEGLMLVGGGVTDNRDGSWGLEMGDLAAGGGVEVELVWRAVSLGVWTNRADLSGLEVNAEGLRAGVEWQVQVENPVEPYVRVESAARPDGVYTLESAAVVDEGGGLVAIRDFGRSRFYLLESVPRARIVAFERLDGREVLNYLYDPEVFVLEGADSLDGSWSEVTDAQHRPEEEIILVVKAASPALLRIRSEVEVVITGIEDLGEELRVSYAVQGDVPVLLGASLPQGPYAPEVGIQVDVEARELSRPVEGRRRFYRLVSDRSVRVTSISTEGRDLVISFE